MKIYLLGKDQEYRSCIELEEGSVHTDLEVLFALIKGLIKKGILTKQQIIDEL